MGAGSLKTDIRLEYTKDGRMDVRINLTKSCKRHKLCGIPVRMSNGYVYIDRLVDLLHG